MNAIIPSVEELSRPAKALIDSGRVTAFGDAADILTANVPTVIAGAEASSYGYQAALLTAVETTARVFAQAPVYLAPVVADGPCLLPGLSHLTLAEAVVQAGAHHMRADDASVGSRPVIVIGTAATTGIVSLQVTWDHWVASVGTTGGRLPERGNMVLAPVAAAALAVAECFKRVLGVDEACYRQRGLNLWQPDQTSPNSIQAGLEEEALGPVLQFLPKSAWMVGLGHLGQGYAWCWRLLPYLDPSQCELLLQDFDKVNVANRSTGMFVKPEHLGLMKSRVVASALEGAGFKTRIVERRLLPETLRHPNEPELALLGVDKLEPRRLISNIGWAFAVDVGLGAGPVDFTGISIHTFPSRTSSHDLAAWQGHGSTNRAAHAQQQDAYRNAEAAGADGCGLVQLAETAVAAPFVGVVAACLALSEPLRILHGQKQHITLSYDAGRTALPRGSRAAEVPRIGFVETSREVRTQEGPWRSG
ncbi:hypothetical protein [Aeromicrobium sp. HA]|uniref:hypothetical protein n=1 Tax=Aeromicrobium sp. HA TaxID=3009077 RepID=UPI0022B03DA8|nr:hypothetical protein [Aeromicrobium sp. HA]